MYLIDQDGNARCKHKSVRMSSDDDLGSFNESSQRWQHGRVHLQLDINVIKQDQRVFLNACCLCHQPTCLHHNVTLTVYFLQLLTLAGCKLQISTDAWHLLGTEACRLAKTISSITNSYCDETLRQLCVEPCQKLRLTWTFRMHIAKIMTDPTTGVCKLFWDGQVSWQCCIYEDVVSENTRQPTSPAT